MSFFLKVSIIVFLIPYISDANAEKVGSCNDELYSVFLDYRVCLNQKECEFDEIRNKFYSKKQTKDYIERSISIDRDIVAIESYYEVCNASYGELFLGVVRADGITVSTVFEFENESGNWVMLGGKLFNYSDLLSMNFIDIDSDNMTIVDTVLIEGNILNCLSKLIGTNKRRVNYHEYLLEVNSCYE